MRRTTRRGAKGTGRAARAAWLTAIVCTAVGAAQAPDAEAYTSASLTTSIPSPRYIVCHEERTAPRPAMPAPAHAKGPRLVPLPRVADARRLRVVPHQVDDTAIAEPIPDLAPAPLAPPLQPIEILVEQSRNDVHCLGLVRGRGPLLRAVSAPPGTRFYGDGRAHDVVVRNLIAASAFDVKEAIGPARTVLSRPLPSKVSSHDDMERVVLHGHAAMTLAELGDVASAPQIRDLLVTLETVRVGSTWRDTLVALVQLDGATASAYAEDLVQRMGALGPHQPSGHDLELVLAQLSSASAARVMPALVRLGETGHDGCLAVGARLRLGDVALTKRLTPELKGTISTNLGATCWSQIIAALAPGRSLDELDVLLYRGRWEEIAELALTLRARGSSSARATLAAKVRAKPARERQGLYDNDAVLRAVALAAVDPSATGALYALVDAETDTTDSPWVGATYAVRAALPDAHTHAKRLLERGIRVDVPHAQLDVLRSGVAVSWRVRLVRALGAQRSPLVALGLLGRDSHAREAAMFEVSRAKPDACELVGDAAKLAPYGEVVDSAFWALTALGDRCRPTMERLARDRTAPGFVRGMAIEHLAMIRASSAETLARAWESEGDVASIGRASLARSRIIQRSPE